MSTERVPDIISFLKSCYEADNREQQVLNYFDSKIEGRLFLDSAELLNGELPHLPITQDSLERINGILKGYLHEKHLFLSAFFLKGTLEQEGKRKKVCAPLLLIPATICEHLEYPCIEIDMSGISVNKGFFKSIDAIDDDDLESIAEIAEILNEPTIGFDQVAAIEKTLSRRYPEVATEDLLLFPNLLNEAQLKKASKELKIVAAAGFCVLRKSRNTVSVLKELETLTELSNEDLAPSIQQIIGNKESAAHNVTRFNVVPAALNAAQLQALDNAERLRLSTIIGPPGTGKSYTIAATAIQAIYHGESVLITSAKNQAVDVVQQKITDAFNLPNVCIRSGGKGDYKSQLKQHIDNLLMNIGVEWVEESAVEEKEMVVKTIIDEIYHEEEAYRNGALSASSIGAKLTAPGHSWVKKWRHFRERRRAPKRTALWHILGELESLYPRKNKTLKELIQLRYKFLLHRTVRRHRYELKTFSSAIRSRTIQTRDERFAKIDFDTLKNAFPIWLVNLSEVGQVLPLTKGLFDLVIIDEASQCDIATALPLLQRAKRAVICGDPKQLRHVSFLSSRKTKMLAEKRSLDGQEMELFDFRRRSLLDLVLDRTDKQDSISFLNEHFRSSPKIIDFSNQQFYGGNIHLMTEGAYHQPDDSVQLHPVEGTRLNGVNAVEAEYILDQIQLLAEDQKDLEPDARSSIGVLSPFRDQVNHIYETLNHGLAGSVFADHNIHIGTAHSFQGEERDIMFLSFSVDDNAHATALRHLNKSDVFNVSITRAREMQHIVYSRKSHLFGQDTLMGKYLQHARIMSEKKPQENGTHDAFSRDVFDTISSWGVNKVLLDHSISGIRFDLVVKNKGKLFGINLIGYPGAYDGVMDLDRIKIFKRAGNRVFPIPYNHWLYNKELLMSDLKGFILAT